MEYERPATRPLCTQQRDLAVAQEIPRFQTEPRRLGPPEGALSLIQHRRPPNPPKNPEFRKNKGSQAVPRQKIRCQKVPLPRRGTYATVRVRKQHAQVPMTAEQLASRGQAGAHAVRADVAGLRIVFRISCSAPGTRKRRFRLTSRSRWPGGRRCGAPFDTRD